MRTENWSNMVKWQYTIVVHTQFPAFQITDCMASVWRRRIVLPVHPRTRSKNGHNRLHLGLAPLLRHATWIRTLDRPNLWRYRVPWSVFSVVCICLPQTSLRVSLLPILQAVNPVFFSPAISREGTEVKGEYGDKKFTHAMSTANSAQSVPEVRTAYRESNCKKW